MTIPKPPPGLTKCIREKTITGSIISGWSLEIRFVIVNPENEDENMVVDAVVRKLQFCLEENPTERDEESPMERGKENATARKKENTTERNKENSTERDKANTTERNKESTTERGNGNITEVNNTTERDAKTNQADTEKLGFLIFIILTSIPVAFTFVGLIYMCRTIYKRQRRCS